MAESIHARIADELAVNERQVAAAVDLLDGGATVPFIARYRKEATGSLDDTQLRTLSERLGYLRELEQRRGTILESIDGQGKLTPELRQAIVEADTKTRLEDLYLPYKPRRRPGTTCANTATSIPPSPRGRNRKAKSTGTTLLTARHSAKCPPTGHWPCSAAAGRASWHCAWTCRWKRISRIRWRA